MAQTSTTLSPAKDHITDVTGTDISFTSTSGVYTIKSTTTALTGENLKLAVRDLITVSGTTNNNTDTWFVGFTSKLVVGIYVGFDEPASLGRYETGGKTAMPIFKKFILNSISKQDATPFKVPDGIVMMVVDPATGQKVDFNSKNSIYESFKEKNISEADIENNYNDLIFNNSKVGTKEIIRFY